MPNSQDLASSTQEVEEPTTTDISRRELLQRAGTLAVGSVALGAGLVPVLAKPAYAAVLEDEQFGSYAHGAQITGYTTGGQLVNHPWLRHYTEPEDNAPGHDGAATFGLHPSPSYNGCEAEDNVIEDGKYGRIGRVQGGTAYPGHPGYYRLVSKNDFGRGIKVNFDFSHRWFDQAYANSRGYTADPGVWLHLGHEDAQNNYVVGMTNASVGPRFKFAKEVNGVYNGSLPGNSSAYFPWVYGDCYRFNVYYFANQIKAWAWRNGILEKSITTTDGEFDLGQVGVRADFCDIWINGLRIYT